MSDQEIIKLYRSGRDREAFGAFMKAYQEKLYWQVRRMVHNHNDADDVLQNGLVKIWKGMDKFRGESGLFTWAYRIVTNEALSFLKQNAARLSRQIDDPDMLAQNRLISDEHFDGEEVHTKLLHVVARLPKKQQLVFQMKYFQEMKYAEIAEVLKTSEGALKASYHHAVKKIEDAFRED